MTPRPSLEILHLEDNADDAELVRLALTAEGLDCRVRRVERREDFSAALGRQAFDLILADFSLPTFDGVSALAIAQDRCPHVPFILVSGTVGEEHAIEAMQAGATDYVLKHRLARLGPAVRRALREADERRQRRTAEMAMHKLSLAIEQAAVSVFITDADGVIEYVNPAFEQITGYRPEEALGQRPVVLKSGRHEPEFYDRLWKTVKAGKVFREVIINRRKDGQLYYEEQTITPLRDQTGDITHFVSTGQDITERVQNQAQLHYVATHDIITELPNRAAYLDRLQQAIARAERRQHLVAVLVLGLDRFKVINETLGFGFADRLLHEIAERLLGSVREEDAVARLAGDEFALEIDGIHSVNEAQDIARSILAVITKPFVIDEREVFVTASIGVSVYPDDGAEPAALMANASAAMSRAKAQGGHRFQFYSADMNAHAGRRLTLEAKLRHAVERDEFILHYQPQLNMRTEEVIGAEALIRWREPGAGLVAPAEFIPLLEETGLIAAVGQWALQQACRQAKDWGGVPVAVNLSGRQLDDPALVGSIESILADIGLAPELLELEITETMVMQDVQRSVEILQALEAMGVRIAIDDFGTGYSSLSYLTQLPLHTLKIDKAFVQEAAIKKQAREIVKAIISLGRTMQLRVVAEGVETRAQATFLRAQGCDAAQGYLFGRPREAAELARLLQKKTRAG